MKTYIKFKQHKNRLQNIKQIEQRKYRLGTIIDLKLQGGLNQFDRTLTSPLASAVV